MTDRLLLLSTNAWLAELKGKNLIVDLGLNSPTDTSSSGIKDIQFKDGQIIIELAE